MPRNSSGTYSLPSGNPVTSGTLIESSWANTTLSDLGSAMTDSLSRNGEGGMTAAFRAFAGTVSAPGISFTAETASGWYRAGSGDIRFSLGGTDKITVTSAGMTLADALALASGGTGATTAAGARTNILPSYSTNALKVLRVNSGGTDVEWASASAGTVTSITAGTGLTGGTITGSGTIAIDSTVATLTGSQTLTNKTLTNPTVTNYVETPYSANTGTAITVDLTNGTVQILTLTGNATITMPTAVSGKSFVMYLKQDGTGSRTVTWSTVKWPGGTAPTVTSTASKQDIYSFFSDGTNWYGVTVGQNYTP